MDANSTTVLRWRFLISGSRRAPKRSASRTNYTLLDREKGRGGGGGEKSERALFSYYRDGVRISQFTFSFSRYIVSRFSGLFGSFPRSPERRKDATDPGAPGEKFFGEENEEGGSEWGEGEEREGPSESINIRRGKLQAETLMDPARVGCWGGPPGIGWVGGDAGGLAVVISLPKPASSLLSPSRSGGQLPR